MIRDRGGLFLQESHRACTVSLETWHRRLGHVAVEKLDHMAKRGIVSDLKLETSPNHQPKCEACVLGKSHRESQPKGPVDRAKRPGLMLHCDLCGPMETESMGGKRYAIVFTDDYSRYRFVYFVRTKDELLRCFQQVVAEVRAEGFNVRRLHSDGGGEFDNTAVEEYCIAEGIKHTFSSPYSPAQNGVAEQTWRRIFEMARCMLTTGGIPKKYWTYAVSSAVYITNRIGTKANVEGRSPYELWKGKKPSVRHMRIFGSRAFVHSEVGVKKLDVKARKGVFLGYDAKSRSYLVLLDSTRNVVRSRSVVFDEETFPWKQSTVGHEETEVEMLIDCGEERRNEDDEEKVEPESERPTDGGQSDVKTEPDESHRVDEPGDTVENAETYSKVELRRSTRQQDPAYKHKVLSHRVDVAELVETAYRTFENVREPQSFEEAINGPDADVWKDAMDVEMEALRRMGTWELVAKPVGKTIVGCKWVYKLKYKPDGSVERHKARLVAQGFCQKKGIDYQDAFSPVARFTSFRMLLALAAKGNWILEQTDVSNAFLNVTIKEELYMRQPRGYEEKGGNGVELVCRLRKGLYGFKPMPRYWNQDIDAYLLEFGFSRSKVDPCLYILHENGQILVLLLYVDDMCYGGSCLVLVKRFKSSIERRFKVTHQGPISWLLGMELSRNLSYKSITISQKKYLNDLLRRFEMSECKSVLSPMTKQSMSQEERVVLTEEHRQMYQSLIGGLLYLVVCTRPDIAFAVIALTRRMQKPSEGDWIAAKRVMRYLKGTAEKGITYRAEGGELVGYADADWAGDLETRRSTTGHVFLLGGGSVSWGTRPWHCRHPKQNTWLLRLLSKKRFI